MPPRRERPSLLDDLELDVFVINVARPQRRILFRQLQVVFVEELGNFLGTDKIAIPQTGTGTFPLLVCLVGVEPAISSQFGNFASFGLGDVRILLDPWARIRPA